MRVAIDVTAALKPYRTGVARYLEDLVSAMAQVAAPDDLFTLAARLSRGRHRRHGLVAPDARFRHAWFQGRWGLGRPDATFGPDARRLPRAGARQVVTIHDVFALEEDAEGTPAWRAKMRDRYRDVAEHADAIVFLSTWSRDRFVHHHPHVDPTRLHVIAPGVGRRFTPAAIESLPAVRARLGLQGPYALFLGALVARKNPLALVEAWALLPPDVPPLVFAGPDGGEGGALRARIERPDLAGRVVQVGYVTGAEVPALLAGASLLALPSRAEGYGLPVLEAMACGTPVVHSGRGALAASSGGAGIVADPDDPHALAAACERVLRDVDLSARLAATGRAHAARFAWTETARRTLDVLRLASP